MPEILPDHVPSPRTALFWDGTAYRPGTIDAAGHVQIDVVSTVMDAAAATEATLDEVMDRLGDEVAPAPGTVNFKLQAILDETYWLDKLADALQSEGLDRLIVRGMDQLFSYENNLLDRRQVAISGADGHIASNSPGADHVWVVTNIASNNYTTPTTRHNYVLFRTGTWHQFGAVVAAIPLGTNVYYHGKVYLQGDDVIRCQFFGGLVGDQCELNLTGYAMTRET